MRMWQPPKPAPPAPQAGTSGVLGMSGDHVPLPPAPGPSIMAPPSESSLQKAERVAGDAAKRASAWAGAHPQFMLGAAVGGIICGMLGYLLGAA